MQALLRGGVAYLLVVIVCIGAGCFFVKRREKDCNVDWQSRMNNWAQVSFFAWK